MPDQRKLQREPSEPVVFIVDDDLSMREALVDLFRSMKFDAQAFESAAALMEVASFNRPGCIVLDVRLPASADWIFKRSWSALAARCPSCS